MNVLLTNYVWPIKIWCTTLLTNVILVADIDILRSRIHENRSEL